MDAYVVAQDKKDKNFKENEKLILRRRSLLIRMSNINRAIFFGTTTGLLISMVILTVFASES